MVDDTLSAAVIAYLGVPGRSDGRMPAERLAESTRNPELLAQVEALIADLDTADPPLWQTPSLAEMSTRASAYLATRHPELSPAAVRAIAAWFTYNWR